MSKIAIVGAGYVGLTTAACLCDLGNNVAVVDVDEERIAQLCSGCLPVFEPGLEEAIARNITAGRLRFTTQYSHALDGAEYAFIAVGTPESNNGEADIRSVLHAAREIARAMSTSLVIVNKSTVPIGTGDVVCDLIQSERPDVNCCVVSNPEFLREGSALHDFMHPDRVVIGADDSAAVERVAALYRAIDAPIVATDLRSAEMIKYASNAFLATKISFINEMASIAQCVNADIAVVARGMGLDHRIGPAFLEAGIGFGGSCLPKDVKALAAIARRFHYHPELLRAVLEINEDKRRLVVEILRDLLGSLDGRIIGLLGLSFKPGTDDIRNAPSVDIVNFLLEARATVRAYDPVAIANARHFIPGAIFCDDAYAVAQGADALVVVTEWSEFKGLDLPRIHTLMRTPVLVDGRNVYDPVEATRTGFVYRGIGRRLALQPFTESAALQRKPVSSHAPQA